MNIYFTYKNEQEKKELINIMTAEAKCHFDKNDFSKVKSDVIRKNSPLKWCSIKIKNAAYFNDIEKAKHIVEETSEDFLTDYVSDVQENLYFVPEEVRGD